MSVVFAVLQIVLAIALFESLRVLTKIPGSGGLLRSAFGCSAAIVVFMALCVGGVGALLRYFTTESPPPLDAIDGLAIAAIVVAGGVYLALLYRRRRRALAGSGGRLVADPAHPQRAA